MNTPSHEPSASTEHAWLAEGIQSGKIRDSVALEIMKLFDRIPTEFNDVSLLATHNLEE